MHPIPSLHSSLESQVFSALMLLGLLYGEPYSSKAVKGCIQSLEKYCGRPREPDKDPLSSLANF